MGKYRISRTFARRGEISERVAAVMRMFGVTADRLSENKAAINCEIEIDDGDIVYITGPSGAGKSLLLRELEKCIPAEERVNLSRIKLPKNKSVIDCLDGDVLGGLRLLSVAGLGDVFCIVNEVRNLSDGQKYRLRLAMALASGPPQGGETPRLESREACGSLKAGKRFIFADEFCCELDRICAAVISYNIHKFAKRNGVTFILAGAGEDILADLSPDVIVVKELSGGTEVIYKKRRADKTERIS